MYFHLRHGIFLFIKLYIVLIYKFSVNRDTIQKVDTP